jgi:hypothetical protein
VSHHLDSGELFTAKRRPPLASRFLLAGQPITFMSLYLAACAFMPRLVSCRHQWTLSPLAVAGAVAVFAVVFIATVISVGSPSDHVGRRPVLIGATW